jgi:hypothetical protein
MSATNLQRLLTHLKPDSLAARLVTARIENEKGEPKDALVAILKARLDELKSKHDPDRKS